MAGPFAFIPDGMKQVCDIKGNYSLQPVDTKNVDDMQKLLDGERAKVATFQAEIEGLHDDLKEKEQEINRLQAQILTYQPQVAPRRRAA